ncbi:MAG TPA: hydantoinase/carbamoylase family amidase [Solirubrobacteraceae bacterium]|nr:hydantoinase/carbamoylase family amidase [Solirubrobacteraceae bacterium]
MIDGPAVIRALRETDDRSGGRREAWTDVWSAERALLDARAHEAADDAGLIVERDAFANTWYVLPGRQPGTVLVSSHSDCVPGGGWLDGILGVHAGLGVLAAVARADRDAADPDRPTLAIVDWADEEGTRFGRSLLGSSAATGALTRSELDALTAADGTPAPEVVAPYGLDPDALGSPSPRLAEVTAAVELHIEQGPVLEREHRTAAAVAGCLGVRRRRITFRGTAGHAGALAMADRHDPARAAAVFIAETMDAAQQRGGLATVGELASEPAFITAVPAVCRASLDIRHAEYEPLDALDAHVTALLDESRCTADWTEVYRSDPVDFDAELITAAVETVGGGSPLRSGPLHDSASLARAGVPTVMLFAPSIAGVSHARAEDTAEADLLEALEALGRLVSRLLNGR